MHEPLLCSISKSQSCPAQGLKCRALPHSRGHATEGAGIASFAVLYRKHERALRNICPTETCLLVSYQCSRLCVHWSPFLFHSGSYADVMSLLTMLAVTFNPPLFRLIECSSLLQGAAQWQRWTRQYESPTSAAAAGQQSNAGCL
jgi:hypothetical protein